MAKLNSIGIIKWNSISIAKWNQLVFIPPITVTATYVGTIDVKATTIVARYTINADTAPTIDTNINIWEFSHNSTYATGTILAGTTSCTIDYEIIRLQGSGYNTSMSWYPTPASYVITSGAIPNFTVPGY